MSAPRMSAPRGERFRRAAVIVLAFVPALAVAVVAAAAWAGGDDRRIVVETTVPAPLAGAALVLAALAALALLLRRSLDRAARSARAAADAAAQAEHRRFLARLDHELKNPITAIRAAVAATGDPEGPAAAPALRAQLRTIDTQTDRLSRLVGDLRKLAELQTIDLERARVDLGALLDDVVEAVAAAYARTVSVALPAAPWPLPAVPGDPDLLFVALYNVAANAAKYSEAEDLIEVRGQRAGGLRRARDRRYGSWHPAGRPARGVRRARARRQRARPARQRSRARTRPHDRGAARRRHHARLARGSGHAGAGVVAGARVARLTRTSVRPAPGHPMPGIKTSRHPTSRHPTTTPARP